MFKQQVFCFLLSFALLAVDSKPCESILPGLQRMSRGVDITRLDLFPSDFSLDAGFKQVLFDFSCDHSNSWSHPTIKDFHFAVPDQIAAVNTIPGGELNHKVTFHEDVQQLKQTLGIHVGIDANTLAYGDYSLSFGYKRAQEQMLSHNQTLVQVAAYVSAIQMDFQPRLALKPNNAFETYVAALEGATFEKDTAKFEEFVHTFGTHYFESGIFGGYLLQQTIIDNDYIYSSSSKQITTNVKASYLAMINAKIDHDQTDEESRKQFTQSSSTNYYYYGGKANLIDALKEEQFSQWWNSVPSDPWMFGGRIRPIEDLVGSEALKPQVKRAVEVKLLKAYLQEMKFTLGLIKQSNATQLEDIDKLLASAVITTDQVEPIAKSVRHLVLQSQKGRDLDYLRHWAQELDKVLGYELFCKKQVADRCYHEKRHEVNDAIDSVNKIKTSIAQMITDMANIEDPSERAHALLHDAIDLVHTQQTQPLGECREKLFCNLCKDVVVDIIKRGPCDTTHIKQLLNVQL